MQLHEALQCVANVAAERLALPIGWEGNTFTVPVDSHLRAQIVYDSSKYASLGTCALTQISGRVEIKVVTMAGNGDTLAHTLARQLAGLFPRGTDVAIDDGELTIGTGRIGSSNPDGGRLSVNVAIPFYALTQSNNP